MQLASPAPGSCSCCTHPPRRSSSVAARYSPRHAATRATARAGTPASRCQAAAPTSRRGVRMGSTTDPLAAATVAAPAAAAPALDGRAPGSSSANTHDSGLGTGTPADGAAPSLLSKPQLLDVAARLVQLWFEGIRAGPAAVEAELASLLAPDVVVAADRVKHSHQLQGLPEVISELERAHLEYHRSEHRPMLYAASVEQQRAYALVEGRYQDVGALPGHPATFRISRSQQLLSAQVSGGRIVQLWLLRQLTEEDKDELLHEPLACFPAAFPKDSVKLSGDAGEHEQAAAKMVQTMREWWQAWASGPGSSSSSSGGSSIDQAAQASTSGGRRSSRQGAPEAAAAALLAPEFRMIDAYGLWPSMRAHGRRYLGKDAALHYMAHLAHSYDIQLTVLDSAAAEGSLACFSHWQAVLTPKWRAPGEQGGAGAGAASVSISASAASLASLASLDAEAGGEASTQVQQKQQAAFRAAARQEQEQQRLASPPPAAAAAAESAGGAGDGDGAPVVVDGLAVELFNSALQLSVLWVFRGPVSRAEQQLFLEYERRQAAAEVAQAAVDQEVIRAARRAQREQQLHELLDWATEFQHSWGDYVEHVQKQIARQQRVAKQALIRRLQDSSLEEELEEEGEEEVVVRAQQQQQEKQG